MKRQLASEVPVSLYGLCNYEFSLIHPLAWLYEANTVVQVMQSSTSLLVWMLCAGYQAGRNLYLTVLYLHNANEIKGTC